MNINNLRSKINYECSKFRWDALWPRYRPIKQAP